MLATFEPVGTMYAAPSAASTPGESGVIAATTGMPRAPGLAREHPARVAVAPRAERRAADQDVGRELVEPAEQRRDGVGLVLAEVVVAARERHVGSDTRGSEGAARTLRPSSRTGSCPAASSPPSPAKNWLR